MRFIQYLDLISNDGKKVSSVMIPVELGKNSIVSVSPYFTTKGRLYKNVSLVRDAQGDTYKVVGNYNNITDQIKNKTTQIKGFKNG